MDAFKEMALEERVSTPQPEVVALHQTFLQNVGLTGRVFEGALLPVYLFRSGQMKGRIGEGSLRDDLGMGWSLLKRKRLSLFPKMIKGRGEVAAILRHKK
jgi:hypothetical protein